MSSTHVFENINLTCHLKMCPSLKLLIAIIVFKLVLKLKVAVVFKRRVLRKLYLLKGFPSKISTLHALTTRMISLDFFLLKFAVIKKLGEIQLAHDKGVL